ncbi:hypothetical protein V8E51_012803 [Hyaloscypha variabilis]
MAPGDTHSTTGSNGSVAEFDHDSTSSQHKYGPRATKDQRLATQRLQSFLKDDTVPMAHTYGGTTIAEARRRMAEKLKGFEEVFNKGGLRNDEAGLEQITHG